MSSHTTVPSSRRCERRLSGAIASRASSTLSLCASAALGMAAPIWAQSSWVVWSQPLNSNWAIMPSYVIDDPLIDPPVDVEIADDVEVVGTVERLVATGWECFNCLPPDVVGVHVRFYEWTASGPGALDLAFFVPDSDPGLLYSPLGPGTLDITLPSPVEMAGKAFVSVQLAVADGGSWHWWVTNVANPSGSPALTRDRAAGPDAPWVPMSDVLGPLEADVAFMLWGTDATPPPPGSDPCGIWSVVQAPNPAGTDHAILRDVFAISPNDVWAVGEYTALVQGSYQTYALAEHWDGASWTIVPSPSPTACPSCTYATFDAVAATGPDDVWAAGGKRVQGPGGFLGTHVFVARYDGQSWTVMQTPLTVGGSGANVRDIEIVGPDDIWFFGDWIGGPTALAMHWDGSSFTVVPTPNPAGGTPGWGLEAGSAVSADDIWAVGGGSDGDYSGSGYIIHWDGSSWTRVLGPAPGNYQRLWAVKALASDDVWAVGDYFQAGSGYFPLFLHWDGATWTQVPSPAGGSSLVAFDSDDIYSAGGGIVHWDGDTWSVVQEFPAVLGSSVTALSSSTLCDMWGVGRQIVAGDLLTFTAHQHPVEVGAFTTPGDLNGDGAVGSADLGLLLSQWGPCPAGCPADLDGSGTIDGADLGLLLMHWS